MPVKKRAQKETRRKDEPTTSVTVKTIRDGPIPEVEASCANQGAATVKTRPLANEVSMKPRKPKHSRKQVDMLKNDPPVAHVRYRYVPILDLSGTTASKKIVYEAGVRVGTDFHSIGSCDTLEEAMAAARRCAAIAGELR